MIKPEGTDLVSIDDLNGNFDIIDTQMKANADGIHDLGESIPGTVSDAISGSTVVEKTANKVTSMSASSTNAQYPTAKAVWNLFHSIVNGNEVSY